MKKSLKTINKDDHVQGVLGTIWASKLASVVVYLIQDLDWVTPNLLTAASMILNIIAIYLLLVLKQPIIFILLLYFAFILDNADGKLARLHNQSTKFGHLFDSTSDKLKTFLIDAAIVIYYFDFFNKKWLLFGILCHFSFHAVYYTIRHIEDIKHKKNVIKIHKIRTKFFDFGEGNKILITYSLSLFNVYFFCFYLFFYASGYLFGIVKNLFNMYVIENNKEH